MPIDVYLFTGFHILLNKLHGKFGYIAFNLFGKITACLKHVIFRAILLLVQKTEVRAFALSNYHVVKTGKFQNPKIPIFFLLLEE